MIQDSEEYIALFPYQEILSGIKSSLLVHEGVIKLTAASGLGKSALCRQLSQSLVEDSQHVIFFDTAPDSPDDLEERISQVFDLGTENTFTRLLLQKLNKDPEKPITLILIIDDAEQLDNLTLQAIRMLTNIQNEEKSLVKVVLSASPALNQNIATREHRALLQSIAQSFVVKPLSLEESEEFSREFMMQHGLDKLLLEQQGMKLLHKLSGGKPGELMQFWRKLADSRENLPASLTRPLVRRNITVKEGRSKSSLAFPLPLNFAVLGGGAAVCVLFLAAFLFYFFSAPESSINGEPLVTSIAFEEPLVTNVETITETLQETMGLEGEIQELGVEPQEEGELEPVESLILTQDNSIQTVSDETGIMDNESLDELVVEPAQELAVYTAEQVATEGLAEEVSETGDGRSSILTTQVAVETENDENTASPLADDRAVDEDSVGELLSGWLSSWQEKDTNDYLSFYDEEFVPSYHRTLSLWRDDRIVKINRANDITLGFENIELMSNTGSRLTVRFLQSYHTPTYADETLKEIVINVNNASWKIISERNLTVTRLF